MKKIIVLAFLLVSFLSVAQIGGEDEVYLNSERIDPTFNGGGLDKFYEYINREFDFSKVTKTGKMITSFTITETGEIKNIKVVQFTDIESATEIIRVLKKAPKWKPATRNGKEISVDMKFPMDFKTKSQITNQNKNTENPIAANEEIYNVAGIEMKPEYPGGIEEFYKFIRKNFNAPNDKAFKGGKVIISFVVEKDGSLTDFKVIRDAGFGTGLEAIRTLKKCEKWIPAKQRGVPVRCAYTLPINLQSN